MDLPADLRIDKINIEATPTDRAGVLIAFGITPVRSASIILTDSDNQPIELGSQVRLLTTRICHQQSLVLMAWCIWTHWMSVMC